jgi:lipoyl(octanoyl) transferase
VEKGSVSDFSRIKPLERILTDLSTARVYHWGLRDYHQILELQERLRLDRQEDRIPDTWLVGEHTTVITQGVRGQREDLLTHEEYPIYQIDRGGMTTLHNPGQLVIYPIVKTRGGALTQARMASMLLATVRDWLTELAGVELTIEKGRPGLYHGEHKVAAIGISIHRRVTMHGIAINLCNDLTPWRTIVPCGEPQTQPITLTEVVERLIEPADLILILPIWLRRSWGYDQVQVVKEI